jgi:hypothetical protein
VAKTDVRRRRRFWIVGATFAAALAVSVTAAYATTGTYWGYNNLTSSNPSAGTCTGAAAGIACSGWNNWDYSEADWNSGQSSWTLGFLCSSDGLIWGRPFYGTETFKVYDVLWSTYCPTHYNKTAVAHINGGPGSYNYLQARHVIYP